MAEEENKTGSEESTPQAGETPAVDAGTGTQPNPEKPEGKGQQDDSQERFAKLESDFKELQSQHTKVTQDYARQSELISTLDPYIDYDRMNAARAAGGEVPPGGSEDDEEYLTGKQVKQMISDVTKTFKNELLAQNVRAKYPDVCDNGPMEQLVGWYLKNKTLPTDKADKRIEQAVKMAREYVSNLEDKGKQTALTEKEKAEQEAKEKAAAAANASGLATSTPTKSPAATEEDENKPVTADDYVAGRQQARLKRQGL